MQWQLKILKNAMKSTSLLLVIFTLVFSPHACATNSTYTDVEDPKQATEIYKKDTFVVTYEVNDFSEKVERAQILYIPKDFRTEKAYELLCKNRRSSFSVNFLAEENALRNPDTGKLTNEVDRFAKHGYIYSTEYELDISNDDDSESMDILMSGQNRYLTQLFQTEIKKTPDLLGLNLYFEFLFVDTHGNSSGKTLSNDAEVFEVLNNAIKNNQVVVFELEDEFGKESQFRFDVPRMKKFVDAVDPAILEFCMTKRALKD